MTIMSISIAPFIICPISPITKCLKTSGRASIFISSQVEVLMKILLPAGDLPRSYMIKALGMRWIDGGISGPMTGRHGERCYHNTLAQDFEDRKSADFKRRPIG